MALRLPLPLHLFLEPGQTGASTKRMTKPLVNKPVRGFFNVDNHLADRVHDLASGELKTSFLDILSRPDAKDGSHFCRCSRPQTSLCGFSAGRDLQGCEPCPQKLSLPEANAQMIKTQSHQQWKHLRIAGDFAAYRYALACLMCLVYQTLEHLQDDRLFRLVQIGNIGVVSLDCKQILDKVVSSNTGKVDHL
jgi:hypothetical protein